MKILLCDTPIENFFMESLILAQNERWRRGLGMQVVRSPSGDSGVRVSNTWVINLWLGDTLPKGGLIPNNATQSHDWIAKARKGG